MINNVPSKLKSFFMQASMRLMAECLSVYLQYDTDPAALQRHITASASWWLNTKKEWLAVEENKPHKVG